MSCGGEFGQELEGMGCPCLGERWRAMGDSLMKCK